MNLRLRDKLHRLPAAVPEAIRSSLRERADLQGLGGGGWSCQRRRIQQRADNLTLYLQRRHQRSDTFLSCVRCQSAVQLGLQRSNLTPQLQIDR